MTDLHPTIPGKYRRAFDWRVSHGNRHSLTTDTAAMVRLALSDFPDILEDSLEISRKRNGNRTALAGLQMHLLEEVMLQEEAVRHYRKLRDFENTVEVYSPDDQTSGRHSTL